MKRAIIFGITGQDGSHLADLLISKDYSVVGVVRRSSNSNNSTSRIKHLLSNNQLVLVEGDITDPFSITNILQKNADVDEIYNLAAQSHVGTSFKQPSLTWDVTGKGCFNILQCLVDLSMTHCRFYQASSSEMFGASYDIDSVDHSKYQNEDTKFLPQSPYAIAKCAAHHSVRLYREAYNIHASAGILFNHEGPRRGDNFVTKKITNWVIDFINWMSDNSVTEDDIYCSDTELHCRFGCDSFSKLKLGNLEAYRDWGYAADYVEAMWLMLQSDIPDDYVICTGKTHTIRDFLQLAFTYAGLSGWENYVAIDPEFYRPAEVNYLRGDASKAKRVLGWSAKHNLEDLVACMINDRRNEKLQNIVRHI